MTVLVVDGSPCNIRTATELRSVEESELNATLGKITVLLRYLHSSQDEMPSPQDYGYDDYTPKFLAQYCAEVNQHKILRDQKYAILAELSDRHA